MKIVQQVAAHIAQEFREHPERWTRGAYARYANGSECSAHEPIAACWCILGKLSSLTPGAWELWESFSSSAGFTDCCDLAEWNDAPDRTVNDVIALCEKVAS